MESGLKDAIAHVTVAANGCQAFLCDDVISRSIVFSGSGERNRTFRRQFMRLSGPPGPALRSNFQDGSTMATA